MCCKESERVTSREFWRSLWQHPAPQPHSVLRSPISDTVILVNALSGTGSTKKPRSCI